MLNARGGGERRLDSLADNEAPLHLLIRPQSNYTAGIRPQCPATDLLAGIGDCGAVDRTWLSAFRVSPERDHAPMPSSVRTPRTARVPPQHRMDVQRELAEYNTAGRKMSPCRRA